MGHPALVTDNITDQVAEQPTHLRFITATSLFDGHDAAINIMRRIMQSHGAEIIHLGHNRSVSEIINAAIQEDANGIAVSSYQGGHMEYYRYMIDQLRASQAGSSKVFGGGGGEILANEIQELQRYGVTRIYSPKDGQIMGLQGMISDLIDRCAKQTEEPIRMFAGEGDPFRTNRRFKYLASQSKANRLSIDYRPLSTPSRYTDATLICSPIYLEK